MNFLNRKKGVGPWQSALLATTWLAVFFVFSSILWRSGHAEWAFLLCFLAVWVLLSVSWSNVSYAEETGSILASIVDRNFEDVYEKIDHLEHELAEIRPQFGPPGLQRGAEQKRLPWKAGNSVESR